MEIVYMERRSSNYIALFPTNHIHRKNKNPHTQHFRLQFVGGYKGRQILIGLVTNWIEIELKQGPEISMMFFQESRNEPATAIKTLGDVYMRKCSVS